MWPLPELGDIVWCHFPQRPRDLPGPKPRPALVIGVSDDGDVIRVAYGTSQHLDKMMAGEFAIRQSVQPSAYMLAGLSYDTKFDLGNVVEVPWSESFFGVPPHLLNRNHPRLGTLHPCMMKICISAANAVKK